MEIRRRAQTGQTRAIVQNRQKREETSSGVHFGRGPRRGGELKNHRPRSVFQHQRSNTGEKAKIPTFVKSPHRLRSSYPSGGDGKLGSVCEKYLEDGSGALQIPTARRDNVASEKTGNADEQGYITRNKVRHSRHFRGELGSLLPASTLSKRTKRGHPEEKGKH